MTTSSLWLAKLAAWTHDPAEKALVLLRDPSGLEGGTVKALQQRLFPQGIPLDLQPIVKRADHWAAAADRPSWPKTERGYQTWSQVKFSADPFLIHPLSGEQFDLQELKDVDLTQLKTASLDHFSQLLQTTQDQLDAKKTALAFWRFGPETHTSIGKIWNLLPADTRVPDHSIWTHLDLTAALASSMLNDQPALLTLSFGPVQDFIAQARSTSDLWAGSHLLSFMVWQGLKVIASQLGPDAVLTPQLRGVAVVDAWLYHEIGLPRTLFEQTDNQDWLNTTHDANPLFAAALPNKFTAIVPASRAKQLAEQVTHAVRDWVQHQGKAMLAELLAEAGIQDPQQQLPCWQQLQQQLHDFPEVHWAAVPWSLIQQDNHGNASPQQPQLKQVQASFIPDGQSFLDSPAWKLLAKELQIDNAPFFAPNPGILFPAIYQLLDRLGAASKTARHFRPLPQVGFRCTLTGEHEWLTTDRQQLSWTNRQRQLNGTLWTQVAGRFGIKAGEHLGALGLLKRLWPSRFSDWVADITGKRQINRFIISTHAMAMAPSLLALNHRTLDSKLVANCQKVERDAVILPKRLLQQLHGEHRKTLAAQLPALMDNYREGKETDDFIQQLKTNLGVKPEAYYALIYMDGDNMGAWLNGSEDKFNLSFKQTWHPALHNQLGNRSKPLDGYLNTQRPVSPARHMAISSALNSFALNIARHIVEDCYLGKLIYAGGDDVMAMVAVKDLLPCIYALRLAYSGVWPKRATELGQKLLAPDNNLEQLTLRKGHVLLNNRLYRVMGHKATASVGAVIAHHTAPLSHVLNTARQAEKAAKNAGRDAFAIQILKRGGGSVGMAASWLLKGQSWAQFQLEDSRIGLLLQQVAFFAQQGDNSLSRKLAYVVQDWLPQLPSLDKNSSPHDQQQYLDMLQPLLAYQLQQQGGDPYQAAALLKLAGVNATDADSTRICPLNIQHNLAGVLAVAEFLGRAERDASKARHIPADSPTKEQNA